MTTHRRWYRGLGLASLSGLLGGVAPELAVAQDGGSPDTSGVVVTIGRALVDHFGPIGLVISIGLLVWLLRTIRTYERARRSE